MTGGIAVNQLHAKSHKEWGRTSIARRRRCMGRGGFVEETETNEACKEGQDEEDAHCNSEVLEPGSEVAVERIDLVGTGKD